MQKGREAHKIDKIKQVTACTLEIYFEKLPNQALVQA
jgi:hypothetical protein